MAETDPIEALIGKEHVNNTQTTFRIPIKLRDRENVYYGIVDWDVMDQFGAAIRPFSLQMFIPVKTGGHQNRALEALSKTLYGAASFAGQLLELLKKERLENQEFYKQVLGDMQAKDPNDKRLHFSDIFTLSNALKRPIFVYCPDAIAEQYGKSVTGLLLPFRHPSDTITAPPLALFYDGLKAAYVPLVPIEVANFEWPVLESLYPIPEGVQVTDYLNYSNYIAPKVQELLATLDDESAAKLFANMSTGSKVKRAKGYVETLKQLQQKFDLVFKVDMGSTGVARFLCYNVGDDIEVLAKKFVEKEGIGYQYIPKVVQFLRNSIATAKRDPSYAHLFTNKPRVLCTHFPYKDNLLFFGTAQFDKIKNFFSKKNTALSKDEPGKELNEEEMRTLNTLLDDLSEPNKVKNSEVVLSEANIQVLNKLLKWPSACLVPVMDVMRILVLNPTISHINNENEDKEPSSTRQLIANTLDVAIKENTTNLTFLCLKMVTNILYMKYSRFTHAIRNNITNLLKVGIDNGSEKVLYTLSFFLINASVIFLGPEWTEMRRNVVALLIKLLGRKVDDETIYRYLVALGTLTAFDGAMRDFAITCDIKSVIQRHILSDNVSIKGASKDFIKIIPAITKPGVSVEKTFTDFVQGLIDKKEGDDK